MNFNEIPQKTSVGSYQVRADWNYLESWIENQTDGKLNKGLCTLDLNPDFQRGHVWTKKQQTEYVEYKMSGGSASNILYFNCNGWQCNYEGPFVIVDGLQRLTAVRKFLNDEIKAFNKYHKDFSGRIRCLHQTYFEININNLKTRKEVLTWYLEMNQGGTPHSKNELNRVNELIKGEI